MVVAAARLIKHRAEASLELLDAAAERVEVVVKVLHLHVEHVVLDALERLGYNVDAVGAGARGVAGARAEMRAEMPARSHLEDGHEVRVDLEDGRRERAALVAAHLDLLQLLELDDRLAQVE